MSRILRVWQAYKLGVISETELDNCLEFLTTTRVFDNKED